MRLLYFDETEKINSISNELLRRLGQSRDQLLYAQKKENAALLVCSHQLTSNAILMDMVDDILVNLMSKLKKQKWFKFQTKVHLLEAAKSVNKGVHKAFNNSRVSVNYLVDVADAIDDKSKLDLLKLQNAIQLYLGKYDLSRNDLLVDMIQVYVMLSLNNQDYNNKLEAMTKIYNAFYDSWFSNVSGKSALSHWEIGLNQYLASLNLKVELNLNDSVLIRAGACALGRTVNNTSNLEEAVSMADDSELDSELLQDIKEAYEILGLI